MKLLLTLPLIQLMILNTNIFSQTANKNNPEFNQFYNYALQADLVKALNHVEKYSESDLSEEQNKIKQKFLSRFKNNSDEYSYNTKEQSILDLIEIYRVYWKEVLLKQSEPDTAEKKLQKKVSDYLYKNYFVNLNEDKQKVHDDFTNYLSMFLIDHGVKSAVGKTAGIYDLLLWAKDDHADYNVTLPEGNVTVKVVFMNDVVTMGWEDYATLGKYYPGGWATDKELYCVGTAYDTTSENFKVSYLQHEGQHFADYKVFPKLTGPDLEYRAKLVELTYAKESLYGLINFFIRNSKLDRNNPHAFGNYCVIRDISGKLFEGKTESDIEKWKTVPAEEINKIAKELLLTNTKLMKEAGADKVSEFMK
jgi:hypothetical protein